MWRAKGKSASIKRHSIDMKPRTRTSTFVTDHLFVAPGAGSGNPFLRLGALSTLAHHALRS